MSGVCIGIALNTPQQPACRPSKTPSQDYLSALGPSAWRSAPGGADAEGRRDIRVDD